LLIAKTITHQSHIKLLKFLNRCSEFFDSGSSDPEAVVEKPAYSVAVCCNEQKAGSTVNSSAKKHRIYQKNWNEIHAPNSNDKTAKLVRNWVVKTHAINFS
jgi:uncharacterized protein YifE (UPF0438 family)